MLQNFRIPERLNIQQIADHIERCYAEALDGMYVQLINGAAPAEKSRDEQIVEFLRKHPVKLGINLIARRTPVLRTYVKPIIPLRKEKRERKRAPFDDYTRLPLSAPRRTYSYRPNPKRVIYLLHNSRPFDNGGYAVRAHGIIKGLMSHGYEVIPILRPGYPYDTHPDVQDCPTSIEVDGVGYRFFPKGIAHRGEMSRWGYAKAYASALIDVVENERPAVVHAASFFHNAHAALSVRERFGTPAIYEIRGLSALVDLSKQGNGLAFPRLFPTPKRFWEFREEVELSKSVDHLLCITGGIAKLMTTLGVPGERVSLLPNGVMDDVAVSPRAERSEPQSFTLGYIGSIQRYEGLPLLVRAVEGLADKGLSVRLLIVGGGPYEKALREEVDQSRCRDLIEFHGRVPHSDVDAFYRRCDAMVYPRLPLPVCEMVSPLKPFEPMAREIPVIASNVGAMAEIVRDGVNGFTFEAGNLDDLVRSIEQFTHAPKAQINSIAKEAKRFVLEERRWGVLTKDTADIYDALYRSHQTADPKEDPLGDG